MSTEKITFENRKCNCQHAICRGGSAARNLTGQSGSINGSSIKLAPLGFPRGEAVAFSGSSEPMKVTDETNYEKSSPNL